MKANMDDGSAKRLDDVLALVRTRMTGAQRGPLERFVARYFGQVDPEDLDERAPADLYGAALSHWNFARRREPGRAKVRVFNPSIEEHGWQSTHTIIEIVNDDMPFLVDSVTMEVNRHGLTLHLIVHPIVAIVREADGSLADVAAEEARDAARESFIHVEIDRMTEVERLEALAAEVARVLSDVRLAVTDWKGMQERVLGIVADLDKHGPPDAARGDRRGQGVPLVARRRPFHVPRIPMPRPRGRRRPGRAQDRPGLEPRHPARGPEQGRRDQLRGPAAGGSGVRARPRPPDRDQGERPVDRPSARLSRLRRDQALRCRGQGVRRASLPRPLHVHRLQRRSGGHPVASPQDAPTSSRGRASRAAAMRARRWSTSSRATRATSCSRRARTTCCARRWASCISASVSASGCSSAATRSSAFSSASIYAPRENYTTELREKWQAILLAAFNGSSSEFNVHLSESVLARVMITVRTTPGKIPPFDVRELEASLATAARRWDDDLKEALIEARGEAGGNALFRRFGGALPAGYRDEFTARAAVPDIEMMARLADAQPLAMSLYRPLEAEPGMLRFKLFHLGRPVTMSDSLPMLERMGLRVIDERPHRVSPPDEPPVWLHDFGIQTPAADADVDIHGLHAVFEDAFARVFRGEVENDDFNRLVVAARMPAADVVVLRAYAKYMRQIGFSLSQAFVEATLAAHPAIARMLIDLFKLRFDPTLPESAQSQVIAKIQQIDDALDRVDNLSEDRVLRQYLLLVLATTRTNFWRTDADGRGRSFLSFKFDPAKVPGMPDPRPMYEIFVYSPRFEGIHLRGGKVARGGLRWSDRPEDFRTEVLGLVKAQMVKNIVIVPVGLEGRLRAEARAAAGRPRRAT